MNTLVKINRFATLIAFQRKHLDPNGEGLRFLDEVKADVIAEDLCINVCED